MVNGEAHRDPKYNKRIQADGSLYEATHDVCDWVRRLRGDPKFRGGQAQSVRKEESAVESTSNGTIILKNLVLYGLDRTPVVYYPRVELDSEAVRGPDGEYLIKSQNGCNEYFTALGDGRKLPTAAEYCAIMERLHETGNPALDGIVDDMQKSRLCTGTKIRYPKTIIHPGYGKINCSIPLGNHWLDEVMNDEEWQAVFQGLLMSKDAKSAVKALQDASGKRPYIWTPEDKDRERNPERAVWLDFGTDRLFFYCLFDPIGCSGRFRGVRLKKL